MTKRTDKIITFGAIFFLIGFILIIHVPFIVVDDPKQCITTPCEQTQLVSIRDMLTNENLMSDEPIACIQIFDPVCTIRGTFSNQCEADVAGATTLYRGQCP